AAEVQVPKAGQALQVDQARVGDRVQRWRGAREPEALIPELELADMGQAREMLQTRVGDARVPEIKPPDAPSVFLDEPGERLIVQGFPAEAAVQQVTAAA